MSARVRIFVTHPVQYHVPLWRELARHPELDVAVFYFSDHSIRGGIDRGFGVPVAWDVDLQSGYVSEFLCRNADLARPASIRIPDVDGVLARERADWVLIAGYSHGFERQLVRAAGRHGSRVLLRGEFSDLTYGAPSLAKRALREAYLQWFYRHVDRFCYPGAMGKTHLLRRGIRRDRMFFSPYSVDDRLIQLQKASITREEARKLLGIADDWFAFVFSGKLIPRKDPLGLLDAIRCLPNAERVALIVLGDGELRAEFEQQARELFGPRLIFPGFVNQSELGRYFMASDALVMPSRHETWGLVVNEAMHYGLPAIVSDRVGCHPDLVIDGVTGYVYPCGDAQQLAKRMEALMTPRARSREMGRAAQERIRAYTIQESARGVFEALQVGVPGTVRA